MFSDIYSHRKVLVTGHTGFKGSWLSAWLLGLGAQVGGLSIGEPTIPSHFGAIGLKQKLEHFECDIRSKESIQEVFDNFQPEIVFHLAAQAIVRKSFDEPDLTIETNAIGTMNVLESVRKSSSVKAVVVITSDKCYSNVEWAWGYRETDILGGADPYSASKACAENISGAYIQCFFSTGFPLVATARAGNVIGGGDWAPSRIIPDCTRSWSAGVAPVIRYPDATRPWQHVLEPLSGYLCLASRLWREDRQVGGEAFNFGPDANRNETVRDLVQALSGYWDNACWEIDHTDDNIKKESQQLKLNCDKALALLEWHSVLTFDDTVRFTGCWYQKYYKEGKEEAEKLTYQQIEEYMKRAKQDRLKWAI